MPSPFILTKLALPLLQAALKADMAQLNQLTKSNPGSAAALGDITSIINEHNHKLTDVALSGVESLAETQKIIFEPIP